MNCYGKKEYSYQVPISGLESFPNIIKFNCLSLPALEHHSNTPACSPGLVGPQILPTPCSIPEGAGSAAACLRLPAALGHWEELEGEGLTEARTTEDFSPSHSAVDRGSSILFPPWLHLFWTDSSGSSFALAHCGTTHRHPLSSIPLAKGSGGFLHCSSLG